MAGLIPGSATTQGWLPYGSTDASVVFAHPLTSAPSPATLPFTNVVLTAGHGGPGIGSGPKFDPVKGMLCSDVATNNTFAAFYECDTPTFSTAIQNALEQAGQISFEVEQGAVCINNAGYFSNGFNPNGFAVYGGNDMPLMAMIGSGGTPDRLYVSCTGSNGGINMITYPSFANPVGQGYYLNGKRLITSDVPNTNTADFVFQSGTGTYQSWTTLAAGGPRDQIHSWGKGPFCRVNIGWWGGPYGGIVLIAIDGLKTIFVKRSQNTAGSSTWFQEIGIGGDPSNFLNGACAFYMRNLQVSTAVPTWATKPGFNRIALFGDSTTPIASRYDVQFGSGGDTNQIRCIQRAFNSLGYDVDVFGMQATGNTIDDNSGSITNTNLANWKDVINPKFVGNGQYTNQPTVGIPWPDVICLVGGINDVAADHISGQTMQNPAIFLQNSRFLASAQKLINYFMWNNYTASVVAGGTRTPTRRIVVMTPLSNRWGANTGGWGTSTPIPGPGFSQYAMQYVQTALKSLVSWWNTSYPSLAGLVSVADYFSYVGGDNYQFSGTIGTGTNSPPYISQDGTHPIIPAGTYAMGQVLTQELVRVFQLS